MHVAGIFTCWILEYKFVFFLYMKLVHLFMRVFCKFRQFTSAVEISAPQSFFIMGLQRFYIHISPLLLGDTRVSESFSNMFLILSRLCFNNQNFLSCRCCCTQVACCIFRDIQATKHIPRQTPTY